jgi:PPOX class probable F420-dependent enzyme
MASNIATEDQVGLPDLVEFIRPRHNWVLSTARHDGRPQMSPVTGGIDDAGRLFIATYPQRDKCHNIRRNPEVTVCVQSDHFGGSWVQVDGRADVVDMPDALEGLVEYYRCVAGEHPDWDEYRKAMERQGKSLIRIEIERWGPIAKGGFPASVASILERARNDESE